MAGPARRCIDAPGLVPGFIDLYTHYDCQVSCDRALTPSCWHGVTTVVIGNCGFSIAPCRPDDRELLMRMLLYVEGMPTAALRELGGTCRDTHPPQAESRGRSVSATPPLGVLEPPGLSSRA